MDNPKIIRAKLTVICDVIIDDTVFEGIRNEVSVSQSDSDAASQLLFAFLNPKIDVYNDEDAIEGQWDNICRFKGRLKNFELEI